MHTANKKDINIYIKSEVIFQKCIEQHRVFERWNLEKKWSHFHRAHYDWWAFPIDTPSGCYGSAYQVTQYEMDSLRNSQQFIQALRKNAIYVCKSWGWDLLNGKYFQNRDPDQKWQRWPIRLSKMCRSLQIFQQKDLFKNALKYGIILLQQYKRFTYSGKDLTPYFYKQWEQLKKQAQNQKEQKNQEKEDKITFSTVKQKKVEEPPPRRFLSVPKNTTANQYSRKGQSIRKDPRSYSKYR